MNRLAGDSAPALATLALYDFSDGMKLMKTRRTMAPLAFAWGALAIAAILTGGEERDD